MLRKERAKAEKVRLVPISNVTRIVLLGRMNHTLVLQHFMGKLR